MNSKTEHSKDKGFLHIFREAEIHAFPKTWEKLTIVREKYGKAQTFQNHGFLIIFRVKQKSYNFQNMRKVNSRSTGKLWENINIVKLWMGFLYISPESEIYTNLKTWEKWIIMVRETYGKTQTFQSYGFLHTSSEALIHTVFKKLEKWVLIVSE